MIRVTLAGLRTHARRMLATALAVVFGVGFVAGTLIFSDTAQAGFFRAFSREAQNVDVAVERPPAARKGERSSLTAAQVAAVRGVPHAGAVDARMVQPLALLDRRGHPISNFGEVGVAVSTDGSAALRSFDVAGGLPSGADSAVLDKETAAHQRFAVGDTVTVLDRSGGRHRYRLVGLIDFGASKRFSGQSVVGLPAAAITALTGTEEYDEIVLTGTGGVSPAALADEVRHVLGSGPPVVTGDQRRIDLANEAVQVAGQFTVVLLVFGAISLIVATFVIYNTFAILLTQRVRETALLRCVGATRRQVFGAVLLESAIVGLVGGAVGIALGVGVCYGLLALLNGRLGAGVPASGPVLHATPILVGLAIGLVVTVVAALVPAVRATRTAPLAALRDVALVRPQSRRVLRAILAALVATAGIALTVQGTRNADFRAGTFAIVAGGVVTFLAVLILSPLFVGPLTALVGALPGRLFGTPARLATANARRNPGRTAVTTATLMIGVGLMALFSVLVASVKETAHTQLVGHYPVDYVMTGLRYGEDKQAGVPPAYAQALRGRPEFAGIVETRAADARLGSTPGRVAAVDPASLGSLIKPQLTTGSLADLRAGTAILAGRAPATGRGGTVTLTAGGRSATFRVVGTTAASLPGMGPFDVLITWGDLAALAGSGDDDSVMVKAAPGVSVTVSRDALDALAGTYPQVEINSLADLSSDLDNAVNGLIALFVALVGTAILIALFGIANTLSLSVVERTRESATVRALGLTRNQLRATLLIEALLMGVVGALVGIGYGLVYGRLVVAKAFEGLNPALVVPWSWLAGLVVLAALAGVLAAVLPARRAARASIVAAMAEV
jgi:putative ABC transport system permease protein